MYSDAGMMLKEFGVAGVTYNMVNGKPVYTDEILHNPKGLSVSESMARYFRANQPGPGFDQHEDYLKQYYQFPQQVNAVETWSKYAENGKKTLLPPITPTIEESQELASLKAELNTYVSENIMKFVQGTEPIANYDNFIAQLNKMQVKRFIELNQNALDRYNVR